MRVGSGLSRIAVARGVVRLSLVCKLLVVVALVTLGLRAALRLEDHWDTFLYHLPFAALRGGVSIPYDMNDIIRPLYEGFPPLAEFCQGVLWRITGSINATGVVSYLAFLGFLIYAHKVLRASFWITGLIALTAPLVIIHAASSYIDLFGNSIIAIGYCSCVYLYLFPERQSRTVVMGGVLGLVAAAWTKILLLASVGFIFIFLAYFLFKKTRPEVFTRRQSVALLSVAAVMAAMPYLLNWINYSNPLWPVRFPIMGGYFPYVLDGNAFNTYEYRPAHMLNSSKIALFIHSLFEINHPVSYPHRARWIIDQGNADIAFRMGGFWVWNVVTYLSVSFAMLLAFKRKAGAFVILSFITILAVYSQMPLSHELRYFLFIPLSWGATIAMLFPELKAKDPRLAFGLLSVSICLFLYMVSENRVHYKVERRTHLEAAARFEATLRWPMLQKGNVYCAVGMPPAPMLLTGPTMSEFQIVDRTNSLLCPKGSIVITFDGVTEMRGAADPVLQAAQVFLDRGVQLYGRGEYYGSIAFAKRALKLDPTRPEGYNNQCIAYGQMGKYSQAAEACRKALELKPDFELAKNNLAWILRSAADHK